MISMTDFFKSMADQDTSPVVICDIHHKILYMNPVACARYQRFGGERLIGQSLQDCHDPQSNARIQQVLAWFAADRAHNQVHTFYNANENKDVYMVALRDQQGKLIGYYEKHEYRNRDPEPLYNLD